MPCNQPIKLIVSQKTNFGKKQITPPYKNKNTSGQPKLYLTYSQLKI